MRPYEYHNEHYEKHLNERIQAEKDSIGLFCSFQDQTASNEVWRYNFAELKKTIESLCEETSRKFDIVGSNVSSIDWMGEVMRVSLANYVVVVDVTYPRNNLMYELGIVCSLRSSDSVLVTIQEDAKLDCSEVLQLQLLQYSNFEDLKEKLKKQLATHTGTSSKELDAFFASVHNHLSPAAIHLLIQMKQSREEKAPKGIPGWHISFPPVGEPSQLLVYMHGARELIAKSLAVYEYGFNIDKMNLEYAIHPTKLGERYIASHQFLKFVCKGDAVIQTTRNRLLGRT